MTPTRILVVGGGGREHALAWKLAGEPGINAVHVAPGNPGMADEPRVTVHGEVQATDVPAIVGLAKAHAIELAVIGPEAALAAGVTDALEAAGVPTFGPSQAAARIETSKAFCRAIAAAAGVPMAAGAAFDELEPAIAFARDLAAERDGTAGVVVKVDGLAAGKGVTVCDTAEEAEAALRAVLGDGAAHGGRGARVVVEERLTGLEASLIALCDGSEVLGLMPARDHKRLLDGDLGPNTGGMGAYSPLPDLSTAAAAGLLGQVHRPILEELRRRATPFRGALYAGLILTEDGPRLLECNARFGDPEAQVLLPTIGVALAPLLLAAARGDLTASARRLGIDGPLLPTTGQAAVGIVLAAAGYPATPRRGDPIGGIDEARAGGSLVFHSATARSPEGSLVTDGGRILTVVGRGPDLASAQGIASAAADRVTFAGVQRRRDIAVAVPDGPARGSAPTVDAGRAVVSIR